MLSSASTLKYPSKRHQQRQWIVECLYMQSMQPKESIEKLYAVYCEEKQKEAPIEFLQSDFVLGTLRGICTHQAAIDTILKKQAEHWSLERIGKVDLAILRLAIYELQFGENTPAPIVINEAIELSKEYASEDSKRFINGILDKVAKEIHPTC